MGRHCDANAEGVEPQFVGEFPSLPGSYTTTHHCDIWGYAREKRWQSVKTAGARACIEVPFRGHPEACRGEGYGEGSMLRAWEMHPEDLSGGGWRREPEQVVHESVGISQLVEGKPSDSCIY